MNALHANSTTAVRPARALGGGHGGEVSGAVGGRGCAHGTGRTARGTGTRRGTGAAAGVVRNRPSYMSAVTELPGNGGAPGGRNGGSAYGETGPAGGRGRTDGRAEADFTAYVRERRASLYATAYHLTGDRHEAEDLLQSALFSTYRAWDRIADKAALGGYLRRTMTNLHISAWRRRKLNEYPTEELPETPGDCDAMRGTELRAVLWKALAGLPETQRTMLVLRYYEGRTDPEIADILGISVGTVKSSIWRSLRRLRDDETLGRSGAEAFGELVA
ncbi:SigE family RNA polymerase sigma factor [Streptomyces thermolineatus]|uniref:SigE family RNA polymerase sigma factor n=1 Tax=Streptomyces thermolineatus TaxID=44033 RepID=A0ABN3MRK7_9ACTN